MRASGTWAEATARIYPLAAVEPVAVAAELLGAVHRGIGIAQQRVGVGRVAGENRDADARAEAEFSAVGDERRLERAQDLFGDDAAVGLGLRIGDDDHELVAAMARERVRLAHA